MDQCTQWVGNEMEDRSEKTLTTNFHNQTVFIRLVVKLFFIIEPKESFKISDKQAFVIFYIFREFQMGKPRPKVLIALKTKQTNKKT